MREHKLAPASLGVEVDPPGRRAEVAVVENYVLNCQRTEGD